MLGLLIFGVGSESAVWLLTLLPVATERIDCLPSTRVQRIFAFVVLPLIGSSQDTGTDISPRHRSIVLGHESCLAPKYIHVGYLSRWAVLWKLEHDVTSLVDNRMKL